MSSSDESAHNFTGWKTLDNNVWMSVYAKTSVQGYTDVLLIIDRVSFDIEIYPDWTYALRMPTRSDCDVSPSWLQNETIIMGFSHASDTNRTLTQVPGPRVMVATTEFFENTDSFPRVAWPEAYSVKANSPQALPEQYQVCAGNGWLLPGVSLHVRDARAKLSPHINRVQVAIPFLGIVILVNIVKIFGI